MVFKADYNWRSYATPDEEAALTYQDEVARDIAKERNAIRKRCNARHAKAKAQPAT